jgi:transcriptional regulator with XRE-family HTH domain
MIKKQGISEFDVRLGKILTRLRLYNGLRQKEVASCLNISFQQYQKYESGKNSLTAKKLHTLCQFFHQDYAKIFENNGDIEKTDPSARVLMRLSLKTAKKIRQVASELEAIATELENGASEVILSDDVDPTLIDHYNTIGDVKELKLK